jgi:hypothetical protein
LIRRSLLFFPLLISGSKYCAAALCYAVRGTVVQPSGVSDSKRIGAKNTTLRTQAQQLFHRQLDYFSGKLPAGQEIHN